MVITYTTVTREKKHDAAQKAFFHNLATASRCPHRNEATARLVPARSHVKNVAHDLTKAL